MSAVNRWLGVALAMGLAAGAWAADLKGAKALVEKATTSILNTAAAGSYLNGLVQVGPAVTKLREADAGTAEEQAAVQALLSRTSTS